jgi:hypothetical protein
MYWQKHEEKEFLLILFHSGYEYKLVKPLQKMEAPQKIKSVTSM